MNPNEKEIIERHLGGDEAAFSEIVKIYLRPIYNFIFRFVNDRDMAEDLAQETFVKAWKKMKQYNAERNFKTWIFTIAKNTTFDWFKKKKEVPFSRFIDEEGENWLENIEDENFLPDEVLERKNIAEELEKILEKIPLHYRVILILQYKEDFTLHEIAEILDEPYNTIKSRHRRGLEKLNKFLFLKKEKQD
jgi:RNA polymerase sigma-70 factor, ECF subfamily